MKKILPLIIVAVFISLAVNILPALTPSAIAQQAENNLGTTFTTAWVYETPEDSFTNGQVTGNKWWQVNLRNNEDDTKAPIEQLSLNLDSSFSFDNFNSEGLVSSGPPVYKWNYGDIAEGAFAGTYIESSSSPVPVTFTPGFDASRSASEINFWEEGTQTITISLTPRGPSEHFYVFLQVEENDMVDPKIISPVYGEGINLSPDGRFLHIEPDGLELNKEWSIMVTLKVVPKVSGLQYMPYIIVESMDTIASGTISGSSVSRPAGDHEDGVGTWTWGAKGNYVWNWEERLYKRVVWNAHTTAEGGAVVNDQPEETGNLVYVGFVDSLGYSQEGDSFTNSEVTGERRWRVAHTENIKDGTGEPVRDMKITLNSDITFDWMDGWGTLTTKRGPPTYEWTYGHLGEDYTGHPKDASVVLKDYEDITNFTPGFDVSRSFDRTVFSAPGTQTITVTVTPREETFDRVLITIVTGTHEKWVTDLVDAIIIGHSDEWYNESGSEDSYAEFGPEIPAELNTPITVTVTIQVTPKVLEVEYKPMVHVAPCYLNLESDSGTVRGNSIFYADEAGVWTISAEGEYIWRWDAVLDPRGSVNLLFGAWDMSSGSVDTIPQVQNKDKGIPITAIGISTVVVVVGMATYLLIRRRRKHTTL